MMACAFYLLGMGFIRMFVSPGFLTIALKMGAKISVWRIRRNLRLVVLIADPLELTELCSIYRYQYL